MEARDCCHEFLELTLFRQAAHGKFRACSGVLAKVLRLGGEMTHRRGSFFTINFDHQTALLFSQLFEFETKQYEGAADLSD